MLISASDIISAQQRMRCPIHAPDACAADGRQPFTHFTASPPPPKMMARVRATSRAAIGHAAMPRAFSRAITMAAEARHDFEASSSRYATISGRHNIRAT